MEEDDKDYIEIRFDSIKQRIRKLDYKNPGKQDLDALVKRISHNSSSPHIETIKQRIEFLETNNPNHVTLELVKQRITDYISAEDKN